MFDDFDKQYRNARYNSPLENVVAVEVFSGRQDEDGNDIFEEVNVPTGDNKDWDAIQALGLPIAAWTE